ncbi:MAG: hypothetical protein H6740_14140 [Alphaproteobacteria bacterium]|nr:hypothetical protein [Alphaproteobacteria bacterium]
MPGPETLPEARVGPYLRALAAGLDALAPDADFVPLAEALTLLRALDPALSGALLTPVGLHPLSGLPATGWIRRALAEQELARDPDTPTHDEDAVSRAEAVDPALAARLRQRAALRETLRLHEALPLRRLSARWRGRERLSLALDQVGADGRWSRLRVDLELLGREGLLRRGWGVQGVRAQDLGQDAKSLEAVELLLARQAGVPLEGVVPTLERALGAQVSRAARGHVGPFWFPGWSGLPSQALSRGLLLQLSLELLSVELVGTDASEDPRPSPALPLPPGLGRFRQRRFAATPGLIPPLRAWCAQAEVRCAVEPLTPPR